MSRKNTPDDIWRRIQKSGPDECWLWTASRDTSGYGHYKYNGVLQKAHRLVLQFQGVDLAGKVVMHSCYNPPCCNPAHLRAGTQSENVRDAVAKGRWIRPRGEANHKTRISAEQVAKIRAEFQLLPRKSDGQVVSGARKALAEKHGASVRTVHDIVTRHTWRHIP